MREILAKILRMGQKLRLNIIPNHHYANIPDLSLLERTHHWKEARSMVGVQGTEIGPQIEFLKSCVESVEDRSVLSGNHIHETASSEQGERGYGVVESDFLYAFVSFTRPRRVVQVGCGVSTSIILRAGRDMGHEIEVVCVDPYPSDYLRRLHDEGAIELIAEKAQVVDLDRFLEVLPRLARGVYVHFHDIFFPYDYQRNVGSTVFFWSESTLLHAFLINNDSFAIRVSQSMLHYEAREVLEDAFPNYRPQPDDHGLPAGGTTDGHFPASTYLQVV